MKKKIMVLVSVVLVVMVIPPVLYAQSITITSPVTGAVWEKGEENTITWDTFGSIPEIDIQLWKGSTLFSPVAYDITNTGIYPGFYPQDDWEEGQLYRIKILSSPTPTTVAWSGYFYVAGHLDLTSPTSGQVFTVGSYLPIEWTETGLTGPNPINYIDLSVEKYEYGSWSLFSSISQHLFTSVQYGSYGGCQVLSDWPLNVSYRISIRNSYGSSWLPQGTVSDYSGTFTIQSAPNLNPTAPTNLYCEGQTNPTSVTDLTPEFSAIFNDPNSPEYSNACWIKVGTYSGGLNMWDSGWISDYTSVSSRCSNKSYNGSVLSLNGQTYYWQIKFRDDEYAEGTWSSPAQFTMDQGDPPDPPSLSTPDNGATGISINPTEFYWNSSSGANEYNIQVSTSSSFSNIVWEETAYTTNASCYSLNLLTNYYWRVNATNNYGTSSYCPPWSFTTVGIPPSYPALSSPDNGATGVTYAPTNFSWNTSTGADEYHIQVSTDAGFSSIAWETTSSVPSVSTVLNPSTLYYWRVNASNNYGTSSYCPFWSFTTEDAPAELYAFIDDITAPVATLNEPLQGFYWDEYSLMTNPYVRLYKSLTFTAYGASDPQGQNPVAITDAEWQSSLVPGSLGTGVTLEYDDLLYLPNGDNEIRVKVRVGTEESDWSDAFTIHVTPYPRINYPFADVDGSGSMHWSGNIFNSSPLYPSHVGPDLYAMDFNGNGDDYGFLVFAPIDGEVTYADMLGTMTSGYGYTVDIETTCQGVEYRARVGHLSTISVDPGNMVSAGNVIGAVGSTGYSSGSHIHFRVEQKTNPGGSWECVDPHPIWQDDYTRIQETDETGGTYYPSDNYHPASNIVWLDERWAEYTGTVNLGTQGYAHHFWSANGSQNPTVTLTYDVNVPYSANYLVYYLPNSATTSPMRFIVKEYNQSPVTFTLNAVADNQWDLLGDFYFASGVAGQYIQVNNYSTGTGLKVFEDFRLVDPQGGGPGYHLVTLDSLVIDPDTLDLGEDCQVSFRVFNFGTNAEDPDSLFIYFIEGSSGDTAATYLQELLEPWLEPSSAQVLEMQLYPEDLPCQSGDYLVDIVWRSTAMYSASNTGVLSIIVPPYDVVLEPYSTPIIIPSSGGSFNYNIAVANNTSASALLNIWCDVTLPNGSSYGPTLGPVTITMVGGFTGNRDRTQAIPGNAPQGIYTYNGYIGVWPDNIQDQDEFTFEKLGVSDGSAINEWLNYGEEFDQWIENHDIELPVRISLLGAIPNPFNPSTMIRYALPEAGVVILSVFDIQGRLVERLVQGWRDAGVHEIVWNASSLASGIYVTSLQVGQCTLREKVVLIK